jgi:hypothetical protein
MNVAQSAARKFVMSKIILKFKDLETGDTWAHNLTDSFLLYLNFNSPIHPLLLRVGQTTIAHDQDGHRVEIKKHKTKEGNDDNGSLA